MEDAKIRARHACERRAWADAYEAFAQASAEGPLELEEVERWALAASVSSHEKAMAVFEQLHQLRLDAGNELGAARAAFWIAMRAFTIGEMARGGGWLARAQRLVDRVGTDCVEIGYLRLPEVFRATAAGDYLAASAAAAEAGKIGDRHGDRDLRELGRCMEGRALVRQGRFLEGLALLDEAMLAVTSNQLSPFVTGLIYCAVIAACQQSYALDRAREWTAALSAWCAEQPQIVTFAGACLVHRSEILQLNGAWLEASEEARRASSQWSGTKDAEVGNALYQEGELCRLRGAFDEAEQAYARASERGREPQPGLSLLRLAQGRVDLATAAIRRVLSAANDPLQRTRFLPAYVEIMLGACELEEARRAADELSTLAAGYGMELLGAIAEHARGAVTLAEGDARGAVAPLRQAQKAWQRVGAPYLSARIRLLVARAFQALGDEDGAALERDAARKVFIELGAVADVAAADALVLAVNAPKLASKSAHGLSPRELEVLLLLASGKTNKMIACELCLSDKTVDRHVSNLFAKLDVPSRAAATAWAYRQGLLA